MTSFIFILLPFIPLAIWTLLGVWSKGPTEGTFLLRVPVPLLARIKMMTTPFVLGVFTAIVGIVLGRIPWWILLAVLGVFGVALALPRSYTLTTAGIRMGRGVFRRWTEFAGVRRSPSGAILQGGQHASSYPIFLSGNREDDQFVLILRTLVRDSYKGKAIRQDSLQSAIPASQSDGETSTTSSINH